MNRAANTKKKVNLAELNAKLNKELEEFRQKESQSGEEGDGSMREELDEEAEKRRHE